LSGYLGRGTLVAVSEMDPMRDRQSLWSWRRLLGAVVVPAVMLTVAAGCGISLGATEGETEMFKDLRVEGDFRLGGELHMFLAIEQPYAVDVEVRCDLLDEDAPPTATPEPDATPTPVEIPPLQPTPSNKVADVFQRHVGANPEGGIVDEATPVPEPVEVTFNAPEQAGLYRLRCYTPLDEENEIELTFTVQPILPP